MESLLALIGLVHSVTTLGMVVVIWDVQLRRYPAFARARPSGFVATHRQHVSRISALVVPLMIGELISSVALLFVPAASALHEWERWVGVSLVAVAWASTFLVQVPLHGRLGAGFDRDAIRALVRSNWLRTAAWSARGVLVLVALLR